MKTKLFVTSVLIAISGAAFAHGGATMFTPEEFGAVTNAAITQFKTDKPTLVEHFYGITLTRLVEGEAEVGLTVKVYVKHEDGAAPVLESKYTCHKHEANEIECHPQ